MKHILEAFGISFCLVCFCSSVHAEVRGVDQGVVCQGDHKGKNVVSRDVTSVLNTCNKVKPPVIDSKTPYCNVITAERSVPYPFISIGEPAYPLHLETIQIASAGDFSLDESKTILTVNKGGIYEARVSFRPHVAYNYMNISSIGFIWSGLALTDVNGPLARFRFYFSPTNIQGTLTPENYIKFTYNFCFSDSRGCFLSLAEGAQLSLKVENSFTDFTLVGDTLNPALRLTLQKID